MTAVHFELLVEEPSTEAFLEALLPRLLPSGRTFAIHPFEGKNDLLKKLSARLRAYARWLPEDWRIIVIVDRDDDDCQMLKFKLDAIAQEAGLRTKSSAAPWQLVNRIAIEELEAWYFGDWRAVREVYPKVSPTIPDKAPFRDPETIEGGTWEAFERICQRYGYFTNGLRKTEAARSIGSVFDAVHCSSNSFRKFHEAILEAVG